jgi:3-phenylpropionate/trans-cinnamate dioxygenase ferredoxin reductase subunit
MHGFTGDIKLIDSQPGLPYQRPPLSKSYLNDPDDNGLQFRPSTFFTKERIEFQDCVKAIRIDRECQKIHLHTGQTERYDHLVLGLGALPRRLSVDGGGLSGIAYLHTRADADALRGLIVPESNIVVVGAGFIGMEVASAASSRGAHVTVLDLSKSAMSRVVSDPAAQFLIRQHEGRGVRFAFNTTVRAIEGHSGRVTHVVTGDGEAIPADVVLVGIGVQPNVSLAEETGLSIADGIVVDECLLTSDPNISAIGDCALFPSRYSDQLVRLESVQNASDQGKLVAERLIGKPRVYDHVPWFWTEQAGYKLQIAGLTTNYDSTMTTGDIEAGNFSVFCFRGGELLGAESVNRPVDHIRTRKLLAGISRVSEDDVLAAMSVERTSAPLR